MISMEFLENGVLMNCGNYHANSPHEAMSFNSKLMLERL